MSKYIDVEKLDLTPDEHGGMNGVLFVSGGRSGGKIVAMVQRALKHMIDAAPAEDVVKVVYCNECFWRDDERNCTNPHCTKSFYGCRVDDRHYCSYGESRLI